MPPIGVLRIKKLVASTGVAVYVVHMVFLRHVYRRQIRPVSMCTVSRFEYTHFFDGDL